jgi:hypothetical protein
MAAPPAYTGVQIMVNTWFRPDAIQATVDRIDPPKPPAEPIGD